MPIMSWDDIKQTCIHGVKEGLDSHDCPDCQEIARKEGLDMSKPERLQRHLAKPPRRPTKKKVAKARKKPAAKPKASAKKASSGRARTAKVTKKVSRPKKKTTKRRVKHK